MIVIQANIVEKNSVWSRVFLAALLLAMSVEHAKEVLDTTATSDGQPEQ